MQRKAFVVGVMVVTMIAYWAGTVAAQSKVYSSSTANRHSRRMKSPVVWGEHNSAREIERRAGMQTDR